MGVEASALDCLFNSNKRTLSMNSKDLEIFLQLAATENMQQTAAQLDKSASVISKSLKRLESSLGVLLFDRVGKSIVLNTQGQVLRQQAVLIVNQTKQTEAIFKGQSAKQMIRIAAPTILLFKWASVIAKGVKQRQPSARLQYQQVFERQALQSLLDGTADFAIVTTSLLAQIPENVYRLPLGNVTMQVAAAGHHPLVCQQQKSQHKLGHDLMNHVQNMRHSRVVVGIDELMAADWVAPSLSPFCGEPRGMGCDGWDERQYPRNIVYEVNDYGLMGQLIKSGQALAYIPDYWVRELGLVELLPSSTIEQVPEQLLLLSYQSQLLDWLR